MGDPQNVGSKWKILLTRMIWEYPPPFLNIKLVITFEKDFIFSPTWIIMDPCIISVGKLWVFHRILEAFLEGKFQTHTQVQKSASVDFLG